MGFWADIKAVQGNTNMFDTLTMPASELGEKGLRELDNVRRQRLQAQQMAAAMRGVTLETIQSEQAAAEAEQKAVRRAERAERKAGRQTDRALAAAEMKETWREVKDDLTAGGTRTLKVDRAGAKLNGKAGKHPVGTVLNGYRVYREMGIRYWELAAESQPGDIVNGHRLDLVDGGWVWSPIA